MFMLGTFLAKTVTRFYAMVVEAFLLKLKKKSLVNHALYVFAYIGFTKI